jgi:hypothetical protein
MCKVASNTYHDSFGNFCHVIRAPVGRLTMSTDFLMQDSGQRGIISPRAEQHELEQLPVEVPIYLLGSRYRETDRLSHMAWSLFGHAPNQKTSEMMTRAGLRVNRPARSIGVTVSPSIK